MRRPALEHRNSPPCTRGFLFEVRRKRETQPFFRDRDLFFNQLDLLFFGTTSLYIYRRGFVRFVKEHGAAGGRGGSHL